MPKLKILSFDTSNIDIYMRREKFIINLPVLKDYVYSILYNASIEIKKIIPPRFLKLIRSQKAAKHFIERSSLDEKLSLLSYFGINWFLVLVDEEVTGVSQLRDILEKYKEEKKISSLKDIVDLRLFVTSSKEFTCLLGLMAQTIHHQSYKLNLEYTRTGYHIHHWARRFSQDTQERPDETMENSILLAKSLLSASLTFEKCDILLKLRVVELRILLYLYTLKHTYVETAQIFDYFAGYESKVKITGALRTLMDAQYIQRSAIAHTRQFTITGIGIRAVSAFQEAVIQANHFK